MYRQSGVLVNTDEGSKWIFVLSTSRALYVGQKKKGVFQHSSFLSGGATTAAGRLVAHDGVLEVTTNKMSTSSEMEFVKFFLLLPLLLLFFLANFFPLFSFSGYMAIQWSLSPNRRQLQGIHQLPPRPPSRPQQRQGKLTITTRTYLVIRLFL